MGRNRDDSAQMWQRDATCITVSTSNTNPSQSTQCRAGFTCPSGSMGSGCLLEVRFCPQTSWNGLCMAYAWPYASWCDFSAIPRVGCIATRANANLGDPLPLHLALPRPPTQNLIGSKYVLQSCPSFATFSYIFQYLLSNLQFCDHPSVLPRHVLGSNCGIPTTRLTSCSSCTDGNNMKQLDD